MRRQTELPDVFRMYISGNHEVYAVVNGMLNLMSCDEKSWNLLYEAWRAEADTETLEQAKQILCQKATKDEFAVLASYGKGNSVEEIRQESGLSESKVRMLLFRAFRRIMDDCFQKLVFKSSDVFPLNVIYEIYDFTPTEWRQAEEVCSHGDGYATIYYALHISSESGYHIIEARYRRGMSYEEISEENSISKARVCQVLKSFSAKIHSRFPKELFTAGLCEYNKGRLNGAAQKAYLQGRESIAHDIRNAVMNPPDNALQKIKECVFRDNNRYMEMTMDEFLECFFVNVRTANILKKNHICTVVQLTKLTEAQVSQLNGSGFKTTADIKELLAKAGLSLAG